MPAPESLNATDCDFLHRGPIFPDQLIETLHMERTAEPMHSRKMSGIPGAGVAFDVALPTSLKGRELPKHGRTLDHVVRDDGDFCHATTDVAKERGAPIEVGEYHTFNHCLEHAISEAVTEYACEQSATAADGSLKALSARLGFSAHGRDRLHQT